jgi:hypothetical protein
MITNPASATLDIVTLPIGDGWRVRIFDGHRLQFVGGFEAKSAAEEWVRHSARAWLANSREFAERL